MTGWSEVVVKGLDSFLKLDLLRYLVFTRGVPAAPRQIAEDLGHGFGEVTRALKEFVALGLAVPCESDGIPRYALTTSPQARHAIEDLLHAWAGGRRPWTDSNGSSRKQEVA
jgi:hypothetical protein